MKKFYSCILLIALAACGQDKIGYVDTVRLMENSEEKKEIESKYQLRSTALNKKRDSISQAFQLEAQALQVKAKNLSQSKAQEEYEVFQQKGQFIGQQLQQEEQLLQQEGQSEMDSLVNKVRDEIKAYGKANGYTFILGGGEGGSVLYGRDQKDLTDEIIAVLNQDYQE